MAFAGVKQKFRTTCPTELDMSAVAPGNAGLWEIINALPCPVKILDLKVNLSKFPHAKNDVCQLTRYDFSMFNDDSVDYVGEVDLLDIAGLERALTMILNVKAEDSTSLAEELSQEFKIVGFWQDHFYYQITFYDIRKNLDNFIDDLLVLFQAPFLPETVFERFRRKEADFNVLFHLHPDKIRTVAEEVQTAKKRLYPQTTFEQLQTSVADIQLIPEVPEDVQRVFRAAKDLHLFGFFRYHFFTISQHYAFLALESAIKNRYTQSLKGKAILRNKVGETFNMSTPTHQDIADYCRRESTKPKTQRKKPAWKAQTLQVNGEPFPDSTKKLLEWLVNHRVITKGEQSQYDTGIHLRNSLSHLEKAVIFPPSPTVLRRTAYNINKLFWSDAPVG